jgi:hypothetical protein
MLDLGHIPELQFFDYVGVPNHQRWMNNVNLTVDY